MIRYLNRPPYSDQPVRAFHLAIIAIVLVLFAAGCYFLGSLLTIRLLLLLMLVFTAWLFVFFLMQVLRAVQARELITLYGPLSYTRRPKLFVLTCLMLVSVPVALFGLFMLVMAPRIGLLELQAPIDFGGSNSGLRLDQGEHLLKLAAAAGRLLFPGRCDFSSRPFRFALHRDVLLGYSISNVIPSWVGRPAAR